MIDHTDEQQYKAIAAKNIVLSEKYHQSRKLYSEAKHNLDVLFASKLPELKKERKNIGYEMGLIMLLANKEENCSEIEQCYETYVKEEGNFKGLEKVMDANQSFISLGQSLIKNRKQEGVT